MKFNATFSSRSKRERRAVAIITVLVLVAMLALAVTAYLVSMRTELRSASAFENTQQAKLISQSAVSHGIELLRLNIPEPARLKEETGQAPGELWVTNPGRLTVIGGNSGPSFIDLHTGAAPPPTGGSVRDLESVDLNKPLAGEKHPPICYALDANGKPDPSQKRPQLRVKWQNMLRDPSSPPSKENQITGRYAFWMDDESGKINFNVAGGKTERGFVDEQRFWEQYHSGLMPPLFTLGRGNIEYNQNSRTREWALGKLRSINLDVLGDDPNDLDVEALLEQAWLYGFSRYPEAIMDHVIGDDPVDWYHREKYNLTFYSRSPEFNAFGRSRFFTTNIPLSLESGPLYQMPFIAGNSLQRPGDGVLHFHTLMGSLGFTHQFEDPDGNGKVHAANVVNRGQLEMLMGYFRRPWPGYDRSFVDKYGEAECYQMALSMLLMARISTTEMNNNTNSGTGARDWAWRTTSLNYSPAQKIRPGETPERHYWRVQADGKEVLMIPQTPGPHITEVQLKFKLEKAGAGTRYRVSYQYKAEYYMHPFGPRILLNRFPCKVDYLWMKADGDKTVEQEIGPSTPESDLPSRNWNHSESLLRLRATAGGRVRIMPPNGPTQQQPKNRLGNRIVVASPKRYLTDRDHFVPRFRGGGVVFDLGANDLDLEYKIRLGMGVSPDHRRPRQMIPLGETDQDVLEGDVRLSPFGEREKTISYYIIDPRLSAHIDQWKKMAEDEHTLGQPNPTEPEENSSEKSKFRYFSRGGGRIQSIDDNKRTFPLNKPDEFNSRSAVSSKGYWSMLHTGIQNQAAWRTLDLGPVSGQVSSDPPDSVLLDLLGATYPMQHDQWKIDSTLPDEFSTVSFMNSTAGQINLNTRVYPDSPQFEAPERKKPLEAVFKHLRPDAEIEDFVDNIVDYQSQNRVFKYIGEIAEVPGYQRKISSATQFENEEFLRNMAGCLTTRSNTFGLWGVAQVVKKAPRFGDDAADADYGAFEAGDSVTAEKRFFALIERYIWPGKDGVPGNAHLDSSGRWDRIATPNGRIPHEATGGIVVDRLFDLPGSPPQLKKNNGHRLRLNQNGAYPEFDGPEAIGVDPFTARALGNVNWRQSPIESAYNPPQPLIKYRVVYFKYLDS
ncbi:MAG: hypothetical protein AAF585_09155 [Verrucomicrobiota bacterium]